MKTSHNEIKLNSTLCIAVYCAILVYIRFHSFKDTNAINTIW
ncbi:hypothetical protein SPARK1531C2_05467 [Klebsiella grimontii]|nr:hypothetical protein SPARK1531C2_05467 [Klebsiella grimontii]